MSRPGAATPWLSAEPDASVMLEDLRRLGRRNRNHPWPLLLLVLAAVALGLYRGATYRPVYEARIALRIIENDVGLDTRPRPAAALRAWVSTVALSEGNLIQVLERYNPYPRARLRGMDQAVEELRDDIEVDVWRNEFLSEDPRDVLGRAARVAIGYKHADAAVAWNVVEALVKATVEEQRQMRKAQVAYLARGLDPALQRAREELAQRQVEFARAQVESARSRMASVRLFGLREDIERLQGDVDRLRVSRDEAQLRLQVENLDLGLQADIIDQERPQPRPYRARVMAFFALVFGLCALVLGGVVLKAFDRGVYDIEDVRRLGYSVWGALPPYPGDGVGRMAQRLQAARKGQGPRWGAGPRRAKPAGT